jgi:hypothetical protein
MRATERHPLRFLSALAALAIIVGIVGVLPADAMVRYDFEGPFFSVAPQPVLDHCVVEQDGIYHLFYLRGNPAVNIGHATTTDFVHWTTESPVLTLGTWDNKAMWAPYLFPLDGGGWAMYYTGVNLFNAQQSGIAWSTGLFDWVKWPQPVYHPDPIWAEWVENGFAHGRDPHVVEYNDRYYMFVTAKTNTNKGAVACAVSDNLVDWEDIGPIYVHNSWHVLESVFILQRPNGKWHMFFTEETVNGTSHMFSDSLLTGWDIATRRVIDGGHAPQLTDTHLGQMFSRHAVYNDQHGTTRYVLRFTPTIWLNDVCVVPKPLQLAGQWIFVPETGDGFYYQPTWGNNALVRNEIYTPTFVGDGWLNTYEYYTGPLGYGLPGQAFGDTRTGIIRSQPFTVEGNSMSFLIGGGAYPNECYVALVDAQTTEVLYTETGLNSNEMTRRYWTLTPHIGRSVYIEIADMSTAPFGHICVDDIIESGDVILPGNGGTGRSKKTPQAPATVPAPDDGPRTRLLPNSPNPFNPSTTIAYELAHDARARIDVFDARGAHVRTLIDETARAGRHRVSWNGIDGRGVAVASGIYFYRLSIDGRVFETRKMALLK